MEPLQIVEQYVNGRPLQAADDSLTVFYRTTDDVAARAAVLSVETADGGVELVVWDSGDVELNHGTVDDPHLEHRTVTTEPELIGLLDDFYRRARQP